MRRHIIIDGFGIEARQTQRGAADVYRGNGPSCFGVEIVGVGAQDICAMLRAVVVADKAQHHEGGGHAKSHHVAQRIKLRAQIAGTTRESGHAAIKRVKEHAEENERARDSQCAPSKKITRFNRLGCVMNGRETAQQISQGQERWKHLDSAGHARVAQSSARSFLFCAWKCFRHGIVFRSRIHSGRRID